MAAIIVQTLKADGSPKRIDSSTVAPNFLGIDIGPDSLPIRQGGTGGTAWFDLGARALRTSFVPQNANDLTTKGITEALITTEVSDRNTAIGSAVALEVAARDLAISGAVAAEATARDGAITTAIGTEVANRNAAITAAENIEIAARNAAILVSYNAGTAYTDLVALGLSPKKAVQVASTANLSVSAGVVNGAVVDGHTLATGERILLKDQTDPSENGIYIVAAAGVASRSTDMDSLSPIDEINGAWVPVQNGTANKGRIYVQYGVVATLGTSAINFDFYNPLAALVGGDMIANSGSTFSVDLATGSGLESTNPGNAGGQLQVKLDGVTIARGTGGLKVADGGLTDLQIAISAAIAHSKMAALSTGAPKALVSDAAGVVSESSVTATELSYLSGMTGNILNTINSFYSLLNSSGATVSNGDLVAIKSDGSFVLATKATVGLSDMVLGFAAATILNGASGNVQTHTGKKLTGASLTPGKEYFVSASGFALYSAISFSVGDAVYSVGRAVTTTTLNFDPKFSYEY